MSNVYVDPNINPFQMMWVEVIPGCEECRFKIKTSKNTIPLVGIYGFHDVNTIEQDLTPANRLVETRQFAMATLFDVRMPDLKQGTTYRYSITDDISNPIVKVIGTFTDGAPKGNCVSRPGRNL
jgi:hypothetical protein